MKKIIIGLVALNSVSAFAGDLSESFKSIQARIPDLSNVTYKEIKVMGAGDSITTNEDYVTPTGSAYIVKVRVKCNESQAALDLRQQAQETFGLLNLKPNQATAVQNSLYICR